MLSVLTNATPKIASYPFTTLEPNLGVAEIDDDTTVVIADIPGLIEGAAEGAGLGHDFLRHVQRTRVLIHLIEPYPMDGTDPIQNYHTIRNELQLYSHTLAEKPEIVCISKAELTGAEEIQHRLEGKLCREVYLMSSVTGLGLATVVNKATQLVAELREADRKAKEKKQVPVEFPLEKAVRFEEVVP